MQPRRPQIAGAPGRSSSRGHGKRVVSPLARRCRCVRRAPVRATTMPAPTPVPRITPNTTRAPAPAPSLRLRQREAVGVVAHADRRVPARASRSVLNGRPLRHTELELRKRPVAATSIPACRCRRCTIPRARRAAARPRARGRRSQPSVAVVVAVRRRHAMTDALRPVGIERDDLDLGAAEVDRPADSASSSLVDPPPSMPEYYKHPAPIGASTLMNRLWPLAASLVAFAAARARASSTCTAARPTRRGARAWRSASRRRPAPRSPSCRRRPARCSRRSRPERDESRRATSGGPAPRDSYLQAAEEGLLETYRSPNVAQLYDWAQRITDLSKNRVSGVYGGILSLGYNTEMHGEEEAAGAEVLEGPRSTPRYKSEVMLGNPNSSGTAYLMLASLVQVFGEDEAFRYMLRSCNPNVNQYARSGIGPMTAVTRGEIYARQHRAARRDQRDRARLPGAAGAALRRRRLRDRLDGDHQGHAQPRGREALRRLGAHRRRARRSASTSRSTRSRPTAASRCRRRCRSSPTSRSSTTTSRSTASSETRKRLLERWEKEIDASAAMSRARAARRARSGSPSARSASCSFPGTRCRTRCSRSRGCATGHGEGRGARAAADRPARPRLARAARRAPGRGAALALRDARAPRARDGAVAVGATGFVALLAQGFAIGPTGWSFESLGAGLPALPRGQYGMGLGAALVAHVVRDAVLARPRRPRLFQGRRVRRRQRRRRRGAGRALHVLPGRARSCCPALAGRRRRVVAVGVRAAAAHARRSGASAASPATRAAASRGTRCCSRLLCAVALHGARSRVRADRHAHALSAASACCASCRCCRSSRRRS